ncbi:MAG TPA: efflux RND transporter periplasmic adaptor subunit [Anaerolineaceae bacterium]
MSKVVKWLLGIIIALAVVAGGGYLYLRYMAPSNSAASALSQYTFTRLQSENIDTTISATGLVRTNQSGNVTWQASGKVGKVNVKVGDIVKANDILASLDPANLPNNIIQSQQNLSTDQQALDDLKNNKTNLPTLQKAVIVAQTAMDNAQTARNSLNFPRGTADQISAAKAEVIMAGQKLKDTQNSYNGTPGDPSTDARKASALGNLEAAKTALDRSQSNLQYIQGAPSASDITTADNTLALAKAQLADAQRALDNSKGGIDTSKLAADQARIDADNAIIDEQNLRAPFNGTITNMNVLPGDIVSLTSVSFRIDDLSAYFIDMAVSEVDIAKVKTGQDVSLSFDAIPNPNQAYTGKVTYVSQVGTTTNSVVNFIVTVQVINPDTSIKPGITSSGSIVVNSVKNVLAVSSKAIKTVNGKKVVYVVTFTNATGQPIVQPTQGGGRTTVQPNVQTTRVSGQAGSGNQTNGQASGGTNGGNTPTLNEKVDMVQVTVGATNDTLTEISSSQIKAGALIVTNPPSTGIITTTNTSGGGLFSGGLGGLFGGRRGPGG